MIPGEINFRKQQKNTSQKKKLMSRKSVKYLTETHDKKIYHDILTCGNSARDHKRECYALALTHRTATRTGRQPLPLVSALRSATRCLSHLGFGRECEECL